MSGVDGFLVRPFHADDLQALLTDAVHGRRATARTTAAPSRAYPGVKPHADAGRRRADGQGLADRQPSRKFSQ